MSDVRETLKQAQALLKAQQFNEARALLLTIPEDKTAQEWLAKIDRIAPDGTLNAPAMAAPQTATPSATSTEGAPASATAANPAREILQQARALLAQNKTEEARALLLTISDNATAQEWLAKLDSLRPASEPVAPAVSTTETVVQTDAPLPADELPSPISTPSGTGAGYDTELPSISPLSAPPAESNRFRAGLKRAAKVADAIGDNVRENIAEEYESFSIDQLRNPRAFILSRNYRLIAAPIILLAGAAILLHFMFFNWMSTDEMNWQDDDRQDSEIETAEESDDEDFSAWEIALGLDDVSLDLSSPSGNGAVPEGDVRLLDRALLLIPLATLALMVVAGLYFFEVLPPLQSLVALVLLSLFLYVTPGLWEELSLGDWNQAVRDNFNAIFAVGALPMLFSTAEQSFFAFFALILSVVGLVALLIREYGLRVSAALDVGKLRADITNIRGKNDAVNPLGLDDFPA